MLKIMMLSVVKRSSMKVKFWLFLRISCPPTFKDSAAAMAKEAGSRQVGYVTYKWRRAPPADREAAHHLGLQDPLPGRAVPPQRQEGDLRGRGPGGAGGPAGAVGAGPGGEAVRVHPLLRLPGGDARLPVLAERVLGGSPARAAVPHLRAVRRGPPHLPPEHGRRPAALGGVRLAEPRPELAGQPGPGPAQLRAARDPHPLPPQEWLWCESWCSDASKAAAKTIDLCNNPQHKEPKLDMAKRVIAGDLFQESWIELDDEVKVIEAKHNITAQH
ncbi:unnamed protein product [Heterosigma akashiwo]